MYVECREKADFTVLKHCGDCAMNCNFTILIYVVKDFSSLALSLHYIFMIKYILYDISASFIHALFIEINCK